MRSFFGDWHNPLWALVQNTSVPKRHTAGETLKPTRILPFDACDLGAREAIVFGGGGGCWICGHGVGMGRHGQEGPLLRRVDGFQRLYVALHHARRVYFPPGRLLRVPSPSQRGASLFPGAWHHRGGFGLVDLYAAVDILGV